jgi:adapter protein MecA 1/2
MKLEKINDNQIRCTLSKQDLADRQLNLRELAYGTEKAKSLFHDMIQQANYEFGFEVNEFPLMVEAIPLSSESVILQITKVEYPDELDTRFSRFSEMDSDELFEGGESVGAPEPKGADDILGLFQKLREENARTDTPAEQVNKEEPDTEWQPSVEVDLTKMFEFSRLDQVERLAHALAGYYTGCNELYKNEQKQRFYLMVHKNAHTPEEFNKICNIICEYGIQKNYTPAVGAYFAEHDKRILGPDALQQLATL